MDLCAAPGGWLQIASEYMPVSSVIVGVDLAPIAPIRNVITFQSDITTQECSTTIEKTLAGWKADVILHDGAPNVGKNWLHDAYGQNVLVVHALKIACTHLNKGGWFITKIFRSADYNSLIWVFGKLFGKVHATKPQASRSESAEIFVVCQNYKKPAKIDERFFDPTAIFADISNFDETLKKQKADLLKPANKIKKTKAHGYEDGDLVKTATDLDFVATSNHMDYLASYNQIKLTNPDIIDHVATNHEIKECCKDLRILGRKDLLKLLKWRRVIRKDLTSKLMSATSTHAGDENEVELDEVSIESDEEPELNLDDIEAMEDEEKRKEDKRLKRKDEKRRKDYQERKGYGMINEGDILIEEEHDLFSLKNLGSKIDVGQIDDVEPEETTEEHRDPDDIAIERSRQRKSVTFSRDPQIEYFDKDSDYDSDTDHQDKDGPLKEEEPKIKAPKNTASGVFNRLNSSSNSGAGLLTELMDVNEFKIASASKFFDDDTFQDVSLEEQFETDLIEKMANDKHSGDKLDRNKTGDDDMSDSEDEGDVDNDDDGSEKEAQPKKRIRLDPEGLAMASMMIGSDKNRKMIQDEGWNRFSNGDSHLAPKWFREDEEKHCRRNIPVTPEQVREYKQKLREIDAKPIKKVMQAKARKKRRAMKKMDRVRKKVEAITSNEDITQRERINQVRTVYKNATKTKKKEVKLVVGRKGLPTKKPGNAKYKMVDARLKKDLRAKQRRRKK